MYIKISPQAVIYCEAKTFPFIPLPTHKTSGFHLQQKNGASRKMYSRKTEPVNLYCSINRAAQCLLKFWAISCSHMYLSKIYMIIMSCSWAMALCQPIVISTLVLPGQNSVSTTRSDFIRFPFTQLTMALKPAILFSFPQPCSLTVQMEIKTISRMKSSSLFLKIALIFSRGYDSLAMCNKDDLFVRSSLQQEVSAPGLLLHWFKNKQQVPLVGLPHQKQARNILYKEALTIIRGANSNEVN